MSLLPFDFSMAFFFLSRGNKKNVHPAGYTDLCEKLQTAPFWSEASYIISFLLMLRFFYLSYFSPSPAYRYLTYYDKVSPLRTSLWFYYPSVKLFDVPSGLQWEGQLPFLASGPLLFGVKVLLLQHLLSLTPKPLLQLPPLTQSQSCSLTPVEHILCARHPHICRLT